MTATAMSLLRAEQPWPFSGWRGSLGSDTRKTKAKRPRIPGEDIMNEATRIPPPAVELGASGEEVQNLHEIVRKARARLKQNAWGYIFGAAENKNNLRRNRKALHENGFPTPRRRNGAKGHAPVGAV